MRTLTFLVMSVYVFGCGQETATRNQSTLDANPIEGKNLLYDCKHNGAFKRHCKLENAKIFEQQAYESKFTVTYSHNCNIAQKFVFGFEFIGQTGVASFQQSPHSGTKVEFVGIGPVVVRDRTPNLGILTMGSNCSFTIVSSTAEPSENTKTAWNNRKNDLIGSLQSTDSAITAYQDLAVLLPAFSLIKQISENLAKDLSQDNDLKNSLKNMLDCENDQGDECNTFDKLIFESGDLLTLKEKKIVKKVVDELEKLNSYPENCTEEQCPPIIIDDLLGESDKQSLQKVAEIHNDSQSARDELDRLAKKRIEIERQIDELKALSQGWIQW